MEPYEGQLFIDGIDILTLPLHALRSRLAIVPQDPVLFKGSIRSNLDPFDQYSEEDLWAALKKVRGGRTGLTERLTQLLTPF